MSDRKYRQRGYQDDGGDRSPRRRSPRVPSQGPRGRGLGAPRVSVSKCARCGGKIESFPELEATCPSCGADLHTCTNCRHFDSSAPMECRKPIPERIAGKSKRNSCREFEPKLVQEFANDAKGGARDAKAAFDDLFDF